MKMFELLPRPLGSIFRELTHFTCNSPKASAMSPPPKDSVQSKEPFPGSHYFDCNAVFRNCVMVVVGYQQQVIATCLLRYIATNAIVS